MQNLAARRVRRHTILIAACLAFFVGIAVSRWYAYALPAAWLWIVGVGVLLSWRRHGLLTVVAVVVLGLGVGWWRGTTYGRVLAAQAAYYHQAVTIEGRATNEAVYGTRSQLETVLTDVHVLAPERHRLVGDVTVRGFGTGMIYRGDRVRATAKVYPSRGNSIASMSFATLEVVRPGTSLLDRLRRQFAAGMQSALPEPHASFALGLLIGQRTTLPEQTSDQLRAVGLTHIIAVSGYNLTVIVMACRRLLAGRSKFQATALCVVLMVLFLLVTGSSPPIVRASMVSSLGLAAWYYGRTLNPLVLLLSSGAITVAANPLYLWGNVSWYLSFLAFFGVLVLAPLITKRLYGEREPGMLMSILLESSCATIAVLPYILYIFGETSVVGLLANMLVVPLIPLAMVVGLVAGLAGMCVPLVAGWLAWPATFVLTYMLDIAALLSRLPFASVRGIAFPLPALIFSYVVLGGVCLVLWRKTARISASKVAG